VKRVEEVFKHITEGGRIEDLPPMKEVKGAQEPPPSRQFPLLHLVTND
jgi:hypothetical protein